MYLLLLALWLVIRSHSREYIRAGSLVSNSWITANLPELRALKDLREYIQLMHKNIPAIAASSIQYIENFWGKRVTKLLRKPIRAVLIDK